MRRMNNLKEKILQYINRGDTRTIAAKKNIVGSFLNKGIAIFVSLALVPLTIDFVSAEQYGIWLTISSIVSWMSYFDVGFANGFRNKYAESKAQGDMVLARKYLSTTYIALIIIFTLVAILALIANRYINWNAIFNLQNEGINFTSIFDILIVLFSLQMVVNIFHRLLNADQKPALASVVVTIGQILVLLLILIFTHLFTQGSLEMLSWIVMGVPCLVTFIISICAYKSYYKDISPSVKYIDIHLVKDILYLGAKFFIIQISMLFTFQFANIILTHVLGPLAVTQYNIAYKYFSIIQMFMVIVLSPYWSAFTDAYAVKDYSWMQRQYNQLSKLANWSVIPLFIMVIISPVVYRLWLNNSVDITLELSIFMAIYILVMVHSSMCMSLINGIGCVKLQMIVYIISAIISVPAMYWACIKYGIIGVLLIPIMIYLIQMIMAKIQLKKILYNKAEGIWLE